jgi:hypothetical protein
MKNVKNVLLSALVVSFFLLSSCSKDDATVNPLFGTWVVNTVSLDLDIDGKTFAQYLEDTELYTESEIAELVEAVSEGFTEFEGIELTLNSDGTTKTVFPDGTETGTYTINTEGTVLTMDGDSEFAYVVSGNTLTLSFEEQEVDDFNEDQVNETLTIDVKLNMKRK